MISSGSLGEVVFMDQVNRRTRGFTGSSAVALLLVGMRGDNNFGYTAIQGCKTRGHPQTCSMSDTNIKQFGPNKETKQNRTNGVFLEGQTVHNVTQEVTLDNRKVNSMRTE